MNNSIKVQYYINPPTFIYANGAQIYFSGFIQSEDNFTDLKLIVNGQTSASFPLNSHYQKEKKCITKSAFVINYALSRQDKTHTEVLIELQFSNQDIKFVHKLTPINIVQLPLQKEARNENEIAILMPTYNPEICAFKKQLFSVLEQSATNFTLFIQDDFSEQYIFEEIEKTVAGKHNINLSRNKKNLGFYRNIENMLYAVSPSFKYICFVDQDDEWMLNKLESQLKFIEEHKADFIYGDLKISQLDGKIISNSFWNNRSNHINDFKALIQNNCATGSTIMFKAHLLDVVLPFPTQIGKVYHDHWICAKSKSMAKVKYQNQVLVNYIQHQQNVTGFHQFKKYNLPKRIKEFVSLLVVCAKVILKKDIGSLQKVIEANQKVYYINYQRIKLFYHKLKKYNLESSLSEIKILINTLILSVKTLSSKYYFNRSEVAIYSAIIFNFALKIRNYIRT